MTVKQMIKLIGEYHSLNRKIVALEKFIGGKEFVELEEYPAELLRKQLDTMKAYYAVLKDRMIYCNVNLT